MMGKKKKSITMRERETFSPSTGSKRGRARFESPLRQSPAKPARQFGRRKGEEEEEDESHPTESPWPSLLQQPPFSLPLPRFSLLRQWESWEVAADESLLTPTSFLPPMVWGFGVCMFRCKWEWEWECVLGRWEWEVRDNSVFLGLCTSHVSKPGWIKKTWYSSLVSSSTRKSGIYLIISQTVFWAQIFRKLMVMGHFAPCKSPLNSPWLSRKRVLGLKIFLKNPKAQARSNLWCRIDSQKLLTIEEKKKTHSQITRACKL